MLFEKCTGSSTLTFKKPLKNYAYNASQICDLPHEKGSEVTIFKADLF